MAGLRTLYARPGFPGSIPIVRLSARLKAGKDRKRLKTWKCRTDVAFQATGYSKIENIYSPSGVRTGVGRTSVHRPYQLGHGDLTQRRAIPPVHSPKPSRGDSSSRSTVAKTMFFRFPCVLYVGQLQTHVLQLLGVKRQSSAHDKKEFLNC